MKTSLKLVLFEARDLLSGVLSARGSKLRSQMARVDRGHGGLHRDPCCGPGLRPLGRDLLAADAVAAAASVAADAAAALARCLAVAGYRCCGLAASCG